MTVTLIESGLQRLLNSEAGPISRDIIRRGEAVLERARENASGPILGIRSGDLLSDLKMNLIPTSEGLTASVGSGATHGIPSFDYPGFHNATGRPWLSSALEAARV